VVGPLWRDAITRRTADTRAALLSDPEAFVPILREFGGYAAIEEACMAIHDVSRWWP
jgi:hypothetical protein